ncbi:MAG: Allene oxide cyclase [Anaerolineae bacterium]|nr:Allene oxide cyclase [Anaerolineae bacterium]
MKSYLLLSVIVIAALLITWSTTSTAQTSRTLHFVEHADNDAFVDNGPKGDSVGDMVISANAVFDKTNKKKVGTDNGYCVRTVVHQAFECIMTLILADGQLHVEGPLYDTKDSVVTIIGGTGAYLDATGQMKVHARNDEGTEFDLIFEISSEN